MCMNVCRYITVVHQRYHYPYLQGPSDVVYHHDGTVQRHQPINNNEQHKQADLVSVVATHHRNEWTMTRRAFSER
jgi:hypothetical protein